MKIHRTYNLTQEDFCDTGNPKAKCFNHRAIQIRSPLRMANVLVAGSLVCSTCNEKGEKNPHRLKYRGLGRVAIHQHGGEWLVMCSACVKFQERWGQ